MKNTEYVLIGFTLILLFCFFLKIGISKPLNTIQQQKRHNILEFYESQQSNIVIAEIGNNEKKNYLTKKNISDEDIFMKNLRDFHDIFFKNLRMEGSFMSVVPLQLFTFDKQIPLEILFLSKKQEKDIVDVHYTRQDIRLIDQQLQIINRKLKKAEVAKAKINDELDNVKKSKLNALTEKNKEKWQNLELDKQLKLQEFQNQIESLEVFKKSAQNTFEKKQNNIEHTLSNELEDKLNRRQNKMLEKLEKAKEELQGLSREVVIYNDAKSKIIQELEFKTKKLYLEDKINI